MRDIAVVKGVSMPRTASGRSSLVEPLPHHISADAVHVSFRADPARIAPLLPPGLEPLDTGEGWAMIAEMTKVAASHPDQAWQDPARSTYNEGVVGFYCRFGDRVGRYSAFVWVDRDWSMGMGPIFGWSKRLAQVDRTRLQPMNPALTRAGPGARPGGTVSRYGARVLSLSVAVPDGGQPLDRLPGHSASTFLYRFVASPSPDVPDLEQLFELPLGGTRMSPVWAGTGELTFGTAPDEELAELGAIEVTGGYLYQRGWTTDRVARLLHDYGTGATRGVARSAA
ncbi:acetoacetate decarboxylase family protein [Enterovirga aerilata]|uniref:Acetoacetate decarboxylase family protein n=1 Tax=Enterovirga aerilata TaxID=2730920 RepID=A0A849I257_9HYPH|nr:acetoacetate decarboxylase family protein [Enterovirga sp. DB1703]